MQVSLTDTLLVPLIKILKESENAGLNAEVFIGRHYAHREAYRLGYNILEAVDKLENLPANDKQIIWDKSLKYCPDDRLNWCKAVHFYNLVK